jgi:hypothetical protein
MKRCVTMSLDSGSRRTERTWFWKRKRKWMGEDLAEGEIWMKGTNRTVAQDGRAF